MVYHGGSSYAKLLPALAGGLIPRLLTVYIDGLTNAMEITTFTTQASRRKARIHQRYMQLEAKYASRQGALVTKGAIRAIEQPACELWTTLVTTYWLQRALSDLPSSHPSQETLQSRLRSEPSSPAVSSAPAHPSAPAKRRPLGFADLPHEIRSVIYEYSIGEQEPATPVLRPCDDSLSDKPQSLNIGLRALADVFPVLRHELAAMLPVLYSSHTYQFDVRDDQDGASIRQWIEEHPEQACVARSIRIKHWTWWHNSTGSWKHAADDTDITLLPSGFIKMTRDGGQFSDPEACSCELDDLLSIHCPSWRFNKPWRLTDFVLALRHTEEPLIQAVMKVLELIQRHDRNFREWRDSPSPCQLCGKQIILLRASREDV